VICALALNCVLAFGTLALPGGGASIIAPAASALTPSIVLEKYALALKSVKEPLSFSFEYALEQSGAHNLSSQHRVYRSGATERDETIAINGQATRHPEVRIFRKRAYRYAFATLAPRLDAYSILPAGTLLAGRHRDYSFRLLAYKPQAFRITKMIVDGVTFLPRAMDYTIHAGANVGTGSLAFTKSGKYWVITSATASVGDSRERIAWSNYRFITVMPPETFAEPRPMPSATIVPASP